MRRGGPPSLPGRPPKRRRGGLAEINFQVRGQRGIIGPRKFVGSRFFDRPVPNIHEKGGTAIGISLRRLIVAQYPERSFMWSAVRRLHRKKKIEPRFNITLRRYL